MPGVKAERKLRLHKPALLRTPIILQLQEAEHTIINLNVSITHTKKTLTLSVDLEEKKKIKYIMLTMMQLNS